MNLPNIETGRLELRLLIQEVRVSLLIPKASYLDWGHLWFSSIPADKCWESILQQATTSSLHILSNLTFKIIFTADGTQSGLHR